LAKALVIVDRGVVFPGPAPPPEEPDEEPQEPEEPEQ